MVGDVDNKGGDPGVRAWSIWDISALFARFCCKPKTALKNKLYFLKGQQRGNHIPNIISWDLG